MQNQFGTDVISRYDYISDELAQRTSLTTSGTAFDPANPPTISPSTATYTTNNLNQYTSIQSSVSSIQLTYDLDGNLTNDGIHQFTYDAENRLISVTPITPTAGLKKVEFAYDYMSRRVQKQVSEWQTDHWSLNTEYWYVYDGWNLIREQTTGGTTTTDYYVWGLDLSGSLQGAGGIGGLLSKTNNLTSQTYLYTFDANGNVGQLVDALNGSIAAHYEYDPFGKLLVSTGSEADSNVFRFSTKYYDPEVGLYYYGYRYYDPGLGRWRTRDPIGEQGGANLYSFVRNAAINAVDPLGTKDYHLWERPTGRLHAGDTIQVGCGGPGQEVIDGTITIEDYRSIDTKRVRLKEDGSLISQQGGGVRMTAVFREEESCCCPGKKWCLDKLLGKEGACCCPKKVACCCPDKSYRWINVLLEDTTPTMPSFLFGHYDGNEIPYYWKKEWIENGSEYFEDIDETILIHWTEGDLVRFRFDDEPFNPVEALQIKKQQGGQSTLVKFETSLVCASQGNNVLAYFYWGFEYSDSGVKLLGYQ